MMDFIFNRNMPFVLRFLRSVKYNNDEALNQMLKYFKWKEKKFPILLNDKLMEIIVNSNVNNRIQVSFMSLEETKDIDHY